MHKNLFKFKNPLAVILFWQGKVEHGSLFRCALSPDFSLVPFNNSFRNEESQSGSSIHASIFCITGDDIEFIKDLFQVFRRNPMTLIFYHTFNLFRVFYYFDENFSIL